MDLIHQNPFRILDLPIDASEREIRKKTKEIETYLSIGKTPKLTSDLPFLHPLQRTPEIIQQAAASIHLPENRLFNSLFWFWLNDSVDELAFDLLKDGKTNRAAELWSKQLTAHKINNKNYSHIRNLAILNLSMSYNNDGIRHDTFAKGFDYAGYIFAKEYFTKYAKIVVGENYSLDINNISKSHITSIFKYVDPFLEKDIAIKELWMCSGSYPQAAREHFYDYYSRKPLINIEKCIEETKSKREANPSDSAKNGLNLLKRTEQDLRRLRQVCSYQQEEYGNNTYQLDLDLLDDIANPSASESVQFQIIADMLADELLQCSIDYYNIYRDDESSENDPGDEALALASHASDIAVGNKVRQRIEANLPVIKEWVADKPLREKRKKVKPAIDYITNQLDSLPDIETISENNVGQLFVHAQRLTDNCKYRLFEIQKLLGKNDDLYLDISNSVAGAGLALCIEYVNKKGDYSSVVSIMTDIEKFDMKAELRSRFNTNKETIYKQSTIQKAIEFISNQIKNTPDLQRVQSDTMINYVTDFTSKCKQKLQEIKNHLGNNDKFYIDISSAVASNALNICIAYANKTNAYFRIFSIMDEIGKFDMEQSLWDRYTENYSVLRRNDMMKKQNVERSSCYIATMVYGDQQAEQVVKLRQFRDDTLECYLWGRFFIKLYYRYAPFFVARYQKSKTVNDVVRIILNYFIEVIKK